jgi:sugar phosphate isomerase/epimerase
VAAKPRIAMLTSALADWEPERIFAELAGAGVDGVEVVYRDPAVAPGQRLGGVERIRRLASAHGLEICGLAAPVGRAVGTPAVVAALRAADRLGAPWVRVFAPPFAGGEPAAAQLARLSRSIERALADADGSAGLLVELSQDTLITSPELARQVLEPLGGRVGVVFDPANMLVEGNLPPEYSVSLLSGLLQHVHVKNSVIPATPGRGTFRSVPLERGLVDWPRVVRALSAAKYTGWLSIDRLSGNASRQRLRTDVAAVRRLLNSY